MAVQDMLGCVFTHITVGDDEITFYDDLNNRKFLMRHDQNCCEHVFIESVVGDMNDLLFSEILMADEVTNSDMPPPEEQGTESYTWTFYKFATRKGYVDIRWFGESNGYYSERVDCEEVEYHERTN